VERREKQTPSKKQTQEHIKTKSRKNNCIDIKVIRAMCFTLTVVDFSRLKLC